MQQSILTRNDEGVGDGVYDSIAWAFEVHVKEPDNPEFNFAILYGTEDAPHKIDFYREAEPLYTSEVARTWEPHTYEVIVGNIGTVYDGPSQTEAEAKYATYVEQSKSGHGRAGGEPVTMMCDGEISQEHTPENDDEEEDEDEDEEEESDGVHNYDPL